MVRAAAVAFALALGLAPAAQAQAPEVRLQAIPATGLETEVEVGQSMVSVAKIEIIPSIVTTAAYSKSGLTVPPGTYTLAAYTPSGRYFQGNGYLPHKTYGISQPATTGGIWLPANGGPPEIYWNGDFGEVRYKVPGIAYAPGPSSEKVSAAHFRRELVYAGVSGSVVRLTYREFSGDLIRPAFSQELTYDLTDGDEIGFRGARFRVLKATNVSIRFVVVRPLAGE